MNGARYRVVFKPSAAKAVRNLPRPMQVRIIAKAESLAGNPRPDGVRKLEGEEVLYRIRVGDYRIVYQIQDRVLVVLVVRVGHRKDVYRER